MQAVKPHVLVFISKAVSSEFTFSDSPSLSENGQHNWCTIPFWAVIVATHPSGPEM